MNSFPFGTFKAYFQGLGKPFFFQGRYPPVGKTFKYEGLSTSVITLEVTGILDG